jgi:hypothetical protein
MTIGIVDIEIKWDFKDYIKLIEERADGASKEAAEDILRKAKQFIQSNAKRPTGKLASEIKLEKSKYRGGGWAVEAQGPNNYDRFYATFVELGSINNVPIPYLRNPLKSSHKSILSMIQKAME